MAGAAPLYGTWVMSIPAMVLKSSPARWPALPVLPEPKFSLPGFAFAYAMNSRTLAAGTAGFTTRTFGVDAIWVTGMKSLTGSYGMLA